MIRLGLLMLVTLAGLFMILGGYGDTDLRADRRPAPNPDSAAMDAGAPALTAPASGSLPSQPPVDVLPAAGQTPERTQRFPGPPLQPSPEYANGTPEPASPLGTDGPVLYVTADRVNMRAGAGTNHDVVTGLSGGTRVEAIGAIDGAWVQIRTAQGQAGFISGQFLSPNAP